MNSTEDTDIQTVINDCIYDYAMKPAIPIETVDFDERMSQLLKHVDDAKSLAEFKQIVTYYR